MHLLLPVMLLLQMPAMAAQPPSIPPAAEPICEVRDPTYDSKEVACSIRSSPQEQRFRLVVNLAGGHDDTVVSMTVRLNGKPLECSADSKLHLMGEDGNVSLHCTFAVTAGSGRDATLAAIVSYSHAQYASYGLERR